MPIKKPSVSHMRAVALDGPRYRQVSTALPKPARGEVLVQVAYAGLNRAELLQLDGTYPLPERKPGIPGLEFSGIVARTGGGWKVGDRVCGIVTEGAFAEYCVSPASTLLPVPTTISLKEAASLPEAMLTAWISLFHQAQLKKGETVLVHGGASGIGVAAIQMAKQAGAAVFATAGTDEKCGLCKKLGAARVINYKQQDFVAALKDKPVDVILDMVGGDYFQKNLSVLNTYGRLAIIAFLRGAKAETNLAPILLKKLSVFGSTLRNRPLAEKAAFVRALRRDFWPNVAKGSIRPVIDSEFALEDAEKAVERMRRSLNLGKIVLKVASL